MTACPDGMAITIAAAVNEAPIVANAAGTRRR